MDNQHANVKIRSGIAIVLAFVSVESMADNEWLIGLSMADQGRLTKALAPEAYTAVLNQTKQTIDNIVADFDDSCKKDPERIETIVDMSYKQFMAFGAESYFPELKPKLEILKNLKCGQPSPNNRFATSESSSSNGWKYYCYDSMNASQAELNHYSGWPLGEYDFCYFQKKGETYTRFGHMKDGKFLTIDDVADTGKNEFVENYRRHESMIKSEGIKEFDFTIDKKLADSLSPKKIVGSPEPAILAAMAYETMSNDAQGSLKSFCTPFRNKIWNCYFQKVGSEETGSLELDVSLDINVPDISQDQLRSKIRNYSSPSSNWGNVADNYYTYAYATTSGEISEAVTILGNSH